MRKTKIIATVGPACQTDVKLKALISAGADLLRINASHTTPQGIRQWVNRIRRAEKAAGKAVAILVDLQGPRVRTGKLKNGSRVYLKQGMPLKIRMTSELGDAKNVTTLCREFPRMVKPRDRVLLDNGMMELAVVSVGRDCVEARVIAGGWLGENKGINLPNAPVTLPALGAKDRQDLMAAAVAGVDYIGLSFVRSEKDMLTVKDWLKKRGKNIPVIAKIEKPKAVDCIREILKVSDGLMVARGDLGIEMGVEKVPIIQKELISQANRAQIPVITATQMLESMIVNSRPTRAEASDVANAVFDGTDAVMLSAETSIGKHPLKALRMMSKIIVDSERHIGEAQIENRPERKSKGEMLYLNAIVHAARHAAKDMKGKAIVVFTRAGKTAALISKFRPLSPIVALTDSDRVKRQLTLLRGVLPVRIRYAKTADAMIRESDRALSRLRFVKKGDPVVILSGVQAIPASRYMAKIHLIGNNRKGA